MPYSSPTNKHIGLLISHFRELRGLTQSDLAKELGTSQSAVARIEKGDQNLTVETIEKISSALHQPLFSLSTGEQHFKIEGGRQLSGTVVTNTSKNAAMGLLMGALLNKGKTTLKKMPHIEEVARILEVLKSIGVSVRWTGPDGNDIEIQPPETFDLQTLDKSAGSKTRSIIMLAGVLIHELQDFSLPNVGGCKLGSRTVRPHLLALKALGVETNATDEDLLFSHTALTPSTMVMYESGDTATENAIMAAARIPGETTIKLASPNYMVRDLCYFLEELGVKIDGIGTAELTVHGVRDIRKNVQFYPSEDPTETMFFLAAALCTQSKLDIQRVPIDFLELELLKLETMGMRYERGEPYKAFNGRANLVDITVYSSELTALEEHIHPMHPGINFDNLPFFAVIATQARGTTLIHDWVYEKRALYYTELDKLGADTILADPHRVFVNGPTPLRGAELVCPPALRPATILLIGMLAAEGTSLLRNVYSINRGYEDLVTRLNALGAKISPVGSG